MNKRLYALHRWISGVALVQLAIWVVSGFFFAVVPLSRIKGTPVDGGNLSALGTDAYVISPTVVVAKVAGRGPVTKLELVGTPRGPVYRGKAGAARFRIDARTGEEHAVDEAKRAT